MLLCKARKRYLPGKCPLPQNLSGRIGSRACNRRALGKKGIELTDREEVCELEAYYIGQALANLISPCHPEKIILGGGVMHQKQLLPLIREQVQKQIAGIWIRSFYVI